MPKRSSSKSGDKAKAAAGAPAAAAAQPGADSAAEGFSLVDMLSKAGSGAVIGDAKPVAAAEVVAPSAGEAAADSGASDNEKDDDEVEDVDNLGAGRSLLVSMIEMHKRIDENDDWMAQYAGSDDDSDEGSDEAAERVAAAKAKAKAKKAAKREKAAAKAEPAKRQRERPQGLTAKPAGDAEAAAVESAFGAGGANEASALIEEAEEAWGVSKAELESARARKRGREEAEPAGDDEEDEGDDDEEDEEEEEEEDSLAGDDSDDASESEDDDEEDEEESEDEEEETAPPKAQRPRREAEAEASKPAPRQPVPQEGEPAILRPGLAFNPSNAAATVYVGNLPLDTVDEAAVRRAVEGAACGEIVDLHLQRNRKGAVVGFAYVEMDSAAAADKLKEAKMELDGRELRTRGFDASSSAQRHRDAAIMDGHGSEALRKLKLHLAHLRTAFGRGDDARMVAVLESMGEVSVTVSAMRETKAGVVLTRLVDAHGEATVRRAAAQARAKLAAQLKERVGAVNARLRTRTILQALPNAESDGNLSTRDRLIKHLSAPPPRLPCVVAVTSFEYDNAAKFDGSRRTRMRKSVEGANSGPVIYWMSRDQRIRDNWALVSAQRQAYKHKAPLVVVFTVSQDFGGASARQAGFQLRGLRFLEADLSTLGIGFRLLVGSNPAEELARYAAAVEARHVVTDFSPLRQAQAWRDDAERRLHDGCGLEYVDAHNVVPCWLASDKPEVSTRTFRPKLHARIHHFLTVFPAVLSHSPFPFNDAAVVGGVREDAAAAAAADGAGPSAGPSEGPLIAGPAPINAATGLTDWGAVAAFLKINWALPEVTWAQPGERAAEAALAAFLESARRVDKYDTEADDPNKPEVRSMLSAHIRYGHLSAQRCCLELVRVAGGAIKDVFVSRAANGMQAWAEEILVRRELSDNFCFFEERYDSVDGFPAWARESLQAHADDARDFLYATDVLERGLTHDRLWNAAQMQLVHTGYMHGWCRKYWAKKLLEWTPSPEEALETAIALNDKYQLDGADAAGITGCAWAIGGVHDMAFKERAVSGKVRVYGREAVEKKVNVARYAHDHPVRALEGAVEDEAPQVREFGPAENGGSSSSRAAAAPSAPSSSSSSSSSSAAAAAAAAAASTAAVPASDAAGGGSPAGFDAADAAADDVLDDLFDDGGPTQPESQPADAAAAPAADADRFLA
ncbi:hypothetical protein FNF29_06417 [Cafeteria roenbergensis]|uniref:Deoxyribodipyrimidine photo-lyase n=1 Tax=Cafeteria roenbergensis TaxID=33653 RepID=A0A5A8C6U3_CAFRO|nr:hypothetical protein FNF29_06417 [Cafeteria roenbergensis]|eukprot:KAA0148792.1 hypothetical protein FNF29_06417 [Cafeteria roenbergensis]